MIWTVVQTSWRRLKNNRSELLLTFVVPIIFFSIFAVIFGSRGGSGSGTPKIKVAIADTAETSISKRATELLRQQPSLRLADRRTSRPFFSQAESAEDDASTVSLATAEDLVRRGMVSAAILFEPNIEAGGSMPGIRVMTDTYDQVASQVVAALVQRAVMTAASADAEMVRPASFDGKVIPYPAPIASKPPEIAVVDVLGGKKTNPIISMYAAGIAVMFVLFSATTASGSLLEERENSTLDRLLCSRLTMDQLLLGKWVYLTCIGAAQITLMFLWGSMVFGIELLSHWEGFAAMTVVTAGAAASFALFLASLCKSRTQLGWVSTIVILTMSALGGSMVPRYLMSESIQRVGLVTFNAWALEGYNKVFWRDLGLRDIEWELGVLTLSAMVFIVLARACAVRWERT
ncbi:MAG: ABC transporter permease [Planctomycetota bacterium]|jgi:ABC-2 type transport system permease protein